MKKHVFLGLFAVVFYGSCLGQPLSGTKSIKKSGGNYSTFSAAITDLNTNGVGTGGVIFEVDSNFTDTAVNLTITTTTSSASNPVLFRKKGTGNNPRIVAGTGTGTTDAIIKITGTDYITFDRINLLESSLNTSTTMQMEWGYAVLKASVTNGSRNVTIRNCTVTLNKSNTSSVGIYINNHLATSTTDLTVTDTNGLNSYCKIYNDSITNSYVGIYIRGYSASSPYTLYDQNIRIGADGANYISNFGGGSATVYGIYAIYQNNLKIANNNINGATGTTTTLYGIFTSTGTSSNIDIYGNTVSLASSATTSQYACIYNSMGSTAANNTVNIYNNIIQNNNYSTSTSATMYCLYNGASAAYVNIYNNTVASNTLAGTGSFYGIYGGAPTNLNIYGNNVYSNTKTGTSGTMYLNYASTALVSFYRNRIYNNSQTSTTGTGVIYGYYNLGSPTYEALWGNKIYNITHSGTGAIYGFHTNTTSSAIKLIYSDTIYGLTTNGTIYGISTATGADIRIYKNQIYNLNGSGASSLNYGIYTSSGTNIYIYNNFISDQRAALATSANAVLGFYFSGGTNIYAFYNTVVQNLTNAVSTFSCAPVYASTAVNLDLRNNIFVNNSTLTGGKAIAYIRSSTTLTTYSNNSNSNCFFAGTPGTTNLIFYDGTNSDQTIAAFKTRVANRDANSFTENPPFVNISTSPFDLHLSGSTATACESGATYVSSPFTISDDIDGNTRNTNFPDIGADEGTFTINDLLPPLMMITPLTNTSSTSARTLTINIIDPSGVPVSGSGLAVLYWKKNYSGSFSSSTATYISGSQYQFSLGSGVVAGDSIYYYIVSRDNASSPNVGCSPSTGASGFVANPPSCSTPPTTFYGYKIISPFSGGTYNIGGSGVTPASGCAYVDLTAAFADISAKEVTGAVNLVLTSYYLSSEEDAFPVVINPIVGTSSTNTITIKPGTGVNDTIQTSGAYSVLKINGAKYIVLDGSNNGSTSRNMTILNTNTTATNIAAIWIASSGTGAGSTNITVKNCNIVMGINSATNFGIYIGGSSISTSGTGDDNDNITIQNNNIVRTYMGIYAGASSSGADDNLAITGNSIGTTTTGYGLGFSGIYFYSGVNGANVSQNDIAGITTSSSFDAVYLGGNVTAGTFSKNKIHDMINNGTNRAAAFNISVSAAAGLNFYNNLIYSIINNGTSGNTFGCYGLYFNTGTGFNVYYNSIYLSGNRDAVSTSMPTSISSCVFFSSSISAVNMRNNALMNSQTAATNGPKSYAVYNGGGSSVFSNINYNDYYFSGAQAVLGFLSADISTLSAWAAATTYDGNSISTDPAFNSTTNLQPNTGSVLLNAGTYISSVLTDYSGLTRSTTNPTIGAFETASDNSGPSISYTALSNTTSTTARTLTAVITDPSGVPTSGSGLPRLYWKKNYSGSWSNTAATSIGSNQFTFTFGSGVAASDTVFYYIVAQDLYTTPNAGCFPSAGASGFSINPPAVTTPPSTPGFYKIIGTLAAGNYNIGGTGSTPASGCSYVDLTAAFNDIGNKEIQGAINLVLTSYYKSSEEDAFPIVINPVSGSSITNTVTIKPASGINDTISGSSTSAIIKLNGADNIVINGSNNGTSSRNLLIENTATTGTVATIWISSNGVLAGCENITIKNCFIKNGLKSNTTSYAISAGSTIGSTGNDNDNLTIQNNVIMKAYYGIYASGASTGLYNNMTILGNIIGDTNTNNTIGKYGIYLGYARSSNISQNSIKNINGTISNPIGMYIGTGIDSTTFLRNSISGIKYTGTSGYGGKGMDITTGISSSALTIANNLISDISGDGWNNFSTDNIIGIRISGSTGGIKIYDNSINLSGTISRSGATTDKSAALYIASTVGGLDIKNNSLNNSIVNSSGTSAAYAIYSDAANTAFTAINYNNYFVAGSQAMLAYLAADQSTLAAWKTASGQDVNSLNGNPAFASPTDLQPTSGIMNKTGVYISTVLTDYAGNTRSTSTPDIGAYEYAPLPTTITQSKNSITASGAVINGGINANNEGTATISFDYGTTTAYGSSISGTPSSATGITNTGTSATLSGLNPNTLYHYRVKATNGSGTASGADSNFTTNAIPPLAVTDSTANLTGYTANLFGHVNAKNAATAVTFNYGKTASYGSTTTASQSPVNGFSNNLVSAGISGLEPNTVYHYRVSATNTAGSVNGYDSIFTTKTVKPSVTTNQANSIANTTATLNGDVNANNSVSVVTFDWGTTTAYGNTDTAAQSPLNSLVTTAVSKALINLLPNTLYHYRVVAINSAGTSYGNDTTFTTSSMPPSAVTDSAGSTSSNSSKIYGTINANNSSTTVSFEYGLSVSYGNSISAIPGAVNGNTNTSVFALISGLLPNTIYHYRVKAVSSGGTTFGNDQDFQTKAILPLATTTAATAVTANSANMNAVVNANNDSTTVTFEFGLTTAYGVVSPATPAIVTGFSPLSVFTTIPGLIPNTTYHYRVAATNSAGTVYGNDTFFTTMTLPPMANTDSATAVTAYSATMNGTINAFNLSTVVTFEYGKTAAYGNTVTANQSPVNGIVNVNADYNLSGLEPNTTYHYRIIAANITGTVYGTDTSFTTTELAPVVFTDSASSVTHNSAVLNGRANAGNSATSVYFEFGLTTAYGTIVSAIPSTLNGLITTAISYNLTGLVPNSTYHFRAFAVNNAGTTYGADSILMTTMLAPSATTLAATAITTNSGILNGIVNANNSTATVTFEYGLTTAYGNIVTASPSPVNGYTATNVSYNLSGLKHSTTYHFRVIAVNGIGTANGNDISFTTADSLSVLTTTAATSITENSAISGGNITDDGGLSILKRGVCWSTSHNPDSSLSTKTSDGSGTGTFSSNLTGLTYNTTYYIRSYSVNALGISYGNELSFTTLPSGIDDNANNSVVKIYSIATDAFVKIAGNENMEGSILIFSLNGKKTIERKISGKLNQINMETFAKGFYVVKVVSADHVYSARIFIE